VLAWQLLENSIVAVTRIGKKTEMMRAFTGDDDIDEDDSELFTVCSELAAEDDLLAPVHEALSLWESCFPADCATKKGKGVTVWETPVDWTVSMDYVEMLVVIYKLMEVIFLCCGFLLRLVSRICGRLITTMETSKNDVLTLSYVNFTRYVGPVAIFS